MDELLRLQTELAGYKALCDRLREAVRGLKRLYESDEGCRTLPEYIKAKEALTLTPEQALEDGGQG